VHIHPTPYPDLNEVLRGLLEGVQAVLGAKFVGAYLQGSFAIGDFDEHSDVDFIIVIEHDLLDDEVRALQSMHARIFALDCAWAQHLEGSYFPMAVLRQPPRGDRGRRARGEFGLNTPLWFLDNGSNSPTLSDHCDTLVVRWVVRERGVVLAGPPPTTLIEPLPEDALRAEILATMRGWGKVIVAHPEQYANRFYQTYIVLNFCRMLHDLRTGYPGSKLAGARWAKANLDPSWAGLIDRTWAGRPHPEVSVRQPADPEDFQATLQFVRYIIAESDAYASANGLGSV
jgi:hypothetical protein